MGPRMDFTRLPCRSKGGAFHVVVEAPRGSCMKLKFDPSLQAFVFERSLGVGAVYPYDWGFIPSTVAEDGDPLDAMVMHDAPTWPGVVIPSTPIGIVRITQRKNPKAAAERNDRVIAVPAADERVEHLRELPRRVIEELEGFFKRTGELTGKQVSIEGYEGPKAAKRIILAAAEAFARRVPSD